MSDGIKDARLLGHDAETGITEHFYYDPDTDGFTIHTQQDVTALVEANKFMHNEDTGTKFGELTRVASIPLSIYAELKKEGIIDDQKRFRKWLNDPEHRFFRTRGGRV